MALAIILANYTCKYRDINYKSFTDVVLISLPSTGLSEKAAKLAGITYDFRFMVYLLFKSFTHFIKK